MEQFYFVWAFKRIKNLNNRLNVNVAVDGFKR